MDRPDDVLIAHGKEIINTLQLEQFENFKKEFLALTEAKCNTKDWLCFIYIFLIDIKSDLNKILSKLDVD